LTQSPVGIESIWEKVSGKMRRRLIF
jgi:hypothetical protein